MKFVKAMTRESVYLILDILYRISEAFIEWYYDWLDRK